MSRMSGDTFDFSDFMDGYILDLSRALNALDRDSVGQLYNEMLNVMDGGGKVHFIAMVALQQRPVTALVIGARNWDCQPLRTRTTSPH